MGILNKLSLAIVVLIELNAFASGSGRPTPPIKPPEPPVSSTDRSFLRLVILPNSSGHQEFIDVLRSAQKSVFLEIFHLSNVAVQDELIAAAARGVNVRIIADQASTKNPEGERLVQKMSGLKNLTFVPSSPSFSITHTKSMIVDDRVAWIGTENLSNSFATSREFSVVLEDQSVVSEMKTVFEEDLVNSANGTGKTPELKNPDLAWSPVNAKDRILSLIASAKTSIRVDVENLSDKDVISELGRAAHDRHLDVRVVAPLCDENPNQAFNVPAMKTLSSLEVKARLMPGPASADQPYIHAKIILVDVGTAQARTFIGSENFSYNSLGKARELGLIFHNEKYELKMMDVFDSDYSKAIDATADTFPKCSKAP